MLATDLARWLALTVFVTPVEGGALCPGNPFHPITVEVDGGLDDRALFDGAMLPPVEQSWPTSVDQP